MVYLGNQYTTRRTNLLERKFVCRRCGLERKVEIRARGVGSAQSPFFLDNAGAARRASDDAQYASSADADRVVALARCPKCKARNGGAWVTYALGVVLRMALLGAILALPLALLHVAASTIAFAVGGLAVAAALTLVLLMAARVDGRMQLAREGDVDNRPPLG